ncbi:hypothetical protein IA57_00185 [Mangrovimonas yunxiaonensis]|uniref:Lipoprotein n=1 Tax=Mangrovimonas yunxiaonensis TaxID=1197477 RepID=A0A084TN11_9FLAO|nr:hypothetical protein [Mangrovimonas yunxiaonensis]KFB02097.1 hypothetical protein IA57_00185 [Mangrovimonas yunxiaonensis]GGH47953.1 hypothetical protein GCM10011364_23180 [Mangrovimonas yunxiaonensis]
MRKYVLLFGLLTSFLSCDDGDVFTVSLDFDDTFNICGDVVFYKTKSDPNESLSLKVTSPINSLEDIIATEPIVDGDLTLVQLVNPEITGTINGSSNAFNYRTYNSAVGNNAFCSDVPPSNLNIAEDYSSTSGTFTITTTLIEDDNDGIPAEMEDRNGNGDLNDDDTDGDGIPNYLDEDDDGDNVLTKTELIDSDLVDSNNDGDNDDDTDNDPLTNPVDTDDDGVPNYLDNDDDGDGILTINEENQTQNQNPANDFTNPNVADYLNPDVSTEVLATEYRTHEIKQVFVIDIFIENISFSNLNQSTFDFGTKEISTESRDFTPEF